MKKWIGIVITMCLAVSMMTGCGKKFDAGAYVKSVLDLTTKGEAKDYVSITGSSSKDAKKLYSDQITEEMAAMGFTDDSGLSDELKSKYEQLIQDVLATAKYKVGKVSEDSDKNYVVELSVSQSLVTKGLNDQFNEQVKAYQDEITKSIQDGGEVPSDADMTAKVYQILYDLLSENVKNITYADENTLKVHVVKKDQVYAIPDDDYQTLNQALYNMDELSQTGN